MRTPADSRLRVFPFAVLLSVLMVIVCPGCTASPTPTAPPAPSTRTPAPAAAACQLPPLAAPTPPAAVPGYAMLDPITNLHMTGRPEKIDPSTYRLSVTGKVDHQLSLSLDDLRCMPRVQARPLLVCPGFFADTATWAGVPISYVLGLAGVQAGASEIDLTGVDQYVTSVYLAETVVGDNFLAYEWEGQPLPYLHGFPVRAVFSQAQGNKWVKWLLRIDVR
jgi:DMSO/TMAO reductase YedYZ molybdopterin-dependent catalytic subunit